MQLIDREDETAQLTNFLEEAVKSKNAPKTTISYNISVKNWKIEDAEEVVEAICKNHDGKHNLHIKVDFNCPEA